MRSRLAALLPSLLALALPLGARVAPHAPRLGGRLGSSSSGVLTLLGGGAVVGAAALRACAKAGKAGRHADDAVRAGTHADDAVRAGTHADDAVRAGAHVDDAAATGAHDAARQTDEVRPAPAADEGGAVADHVAQEGAQRAVEQAATAGDDEEE